MAAALGAAKWLFDKAFEKLSDKLVKDYVSSSELGLDFEKIEIDLMYTQELLKEAEERDISNKPGGLQGLLKKLSEKADEAEDALDELHYFIIQDQLDGTQEAALEVGDGLRGPALHGRHASGNLISGLFSRGTNNDDNPRDAKRAKFDNDDKLPFNRVAMSNKIKSVIEGLHYICARVSDLLNKRPTTRNAASPKRPPTSSIITQDELFYGRETILNQTVNDITSGTDHGETLSVLPIFGPGGIGKTTFTQHLYNHERTKEHFPVRVWVCVSTNFDVLKLTQEILGCIPASENEESNKANDITNLNRLQISIAQRLKSKRFLIILDDIWKCNSEDEWKKLLAPFTKGEARGSMVLVTTRFPRIADMVMKETRPIDLQGLEPGEFFRFFQACIFGENNPGHYNNGLIEIASQIANKLKGSPLAAKTVGRLLKNNLSHEHWVEVLEKNEWRNQENEDDIMPALKISYDYLPFHLKKCFSYCALFPEDHRFDKLEITRFWIAVGIIVSCDQNNKIEDTGLKCLDKLVDNGFFVKVDEDSRQYYIMHDLLHDLAQNVSSQECVHIHSSRVRAHYIPPSIQHLSVTVEGQHDNSFEEEMRKLKRKINIPNLRTLMFFGDYGANIANILNDTFEQIKGLRVLFIVMDSSKSLPHNFSKLIHLQYLKIASPYSVERTLPSKLSRFYHLKFLDLRNWHGSHSLPKDISRLVNLRHFLAKKELHSNVHEVGKMVCLQELKEFCVKKEGVGFELRELGELTELGGELSICNLEKVTTKGEANDAKLMSKRNLQRLRLVWGAEQQTTGSDVLDGLEPPPKLIALDITNHGGSIGPCWLCREIRVTKLKFLRLEGVPWDTLPPFGQLPHLAKLILKNIVGMRQFGPDFDGVPEKSLLHLKTIEFHGMPELVEWAGGINCHVFPELVSIKCTHCPNLSALPFSQCSRDRNAICFPNLSRLNIVECPKLSLPPMPQKCVFLKSYIHDSFLSSLWWYNEGNKLDNGALAFHNLDKVEEMIIIGEVSHNSLTDLQMLNSLRKLHVVGCNSMFSRELDDAVVLRSIQSLCLERFLRNGESLSKVFNCFPALSELTIDGSIEDHEELVLQFPSSSSLRHVWIRKCKNLILPVEDGGGLRELTSLQSLKISCDGNIFSRWSMGEAAQIIKPFPTSLRELIIYNKSSVQSLSLLSNLTSLTRLELIGGDNNSKMDGFNPRITFNLKMLKVYNMSDSCSIAADLLSEVARTNIIPAGSFQLEQLEVDSISAVLVAPICSHLSATLHTLRFCYDQRAESFTEDQEQALQLLTSLKELEFDQCRSLQSLPEGLHLLSSLKRLTIWSCPEIRSLPREGVPTSLQRLLYLGDISNDLKVQIEKLRETFPDL